MTVGDGLAVYGAAIGTLAALGVLWNIRRDTAALLLLVRRGRFMGGAPTRSASAELGVDGPVLFATAVKRGRRPLRVVSAGLQFASGKVLMKGEGLPADLQEGQPVTVWADERKLAGLIVEANGQLPTHAWFLDATNRYHRRKIPRRVRAWLERLSEA